MYGTIARLHPKADRIDELIALGKRLESGGRQVAGYRHSFIFRPDTNPYKEPTLFLIAIFEDRASYVANADSPEQDGEYRQIRALLENDPEWMDGRFDAM